MVRHFDRLEKALGVGVVPTLPWETAAESLDKGVDRDG